MRGPLLVVLLFAPVLAGCLGGEGGSQLTAEEMELVSTGISGKVLTEDLLPIRGATVRIHEIDDVVRSDLEGDYEARNLSRGEYTLSVSAYGFHSLTYRAMVRNQQMTDLDFILEARPTGTPYHETLRYTGSIYCEIAVGTMPEDTEYTDCRTGVETLEPGLPYADFEFGPGAFRLLQEVDWVPNTVAAKKLTLGITNPAFVPEDRQPIREVQGPAGVHLTIVESFLQARYEDGGVLRAYARAAPSIDEHQYGTADAMVLEGAQHPPISVGWATHQPFTMYMTFFYYSTGPAGFTALE